MKKYAYLSRLEELLADLPQSERQDALNYYEEYFEAAGADQEEETAQRLGTPEEVADKILHGEGGIPEHHNGGRILLLVVLAVLVLAVMAVGVLALARNRSEPAAAAEPSSAAPSAPAVTAQPETPSGGETDAAASAGMGYTGTLPAQVQSLHLTANCSRLTVETDPALTEPALEVAGIPGDLVTVSSQDGTLALSCCYEEKVGSITLRLPADHALDTVEAENDVGKIELTGLQADTMTVRADAGNLDISDCQAQSMDLETDVGNISLQDGQADTVQARAQVGRVNVEGIRCTSLLDLQADVGGVEAALPGSAEDYAFSGGTTLGKTSYGGTVYTEQTARADACRLQVRAEVGGIQIRFTH